MSIKFYLRGITTPEQQAILHEYKNSTNKENELHVTKMESKLAYDRFNASGITRYGNLITLSTGLQTVMTIIMCRL